MQIDNGMNNHGTQRYLPVDGKLLYCALRKKGLTFWHIGHLYYLVHNGRVVNVETTSALNEVFYQLGMLHVDNALIGAPHDVFMKLVRENAVEFDQHVAPLLTPEQMQEYQAARKASVSHKMFFRRWMLAQQQATSITTI